MHACVGLIVVGTLVKEMNDLNVNVPKVSKYRDRGVQVSYSCVVAYNVD